MPITDDFLSKDKKFMELLQELKEVEETETFFHSHGLHKQGALCGLRAADIQREIAEQCALDGLHGTAHSWYKGAVKKYNKTKSILKGDPNCEILKAFRERVNPDDCSYLASLHKKIDEHTRAVEKYEVQKNGSFSLNRDHGSDKLKKEKELLEGTQIELEKAYQTISEQHQELAQHLKQKGNTQGADIYAARAEVCSSLAKDGKEIRVVTYGACQLA